MEATEKLKEVIKTINHLHNTIEKLETAVHEAITGLEWRMENDPMTVDKSDYEKIDEWKALLDVDK